MGYKSTNLRMLHSARARHRGVGLVELLISLAISASLLTAIGVATDSSFRAYAINQEQANLMQRARLTTHRILTYIRTNTAHQPITTSAVSSFAGGSTVSDTGISMFTDDGQQIDFVYDATNRQILMSDGSGTDRVLLSGVEAFTVKMEPMQSVSAIKTGGGFDLLKRATILVTIKTSGQSADLDESIGMQTITLSSSVMPRRNSW